MAQAEGAGEGGRGPGGAGRWPRVVAVDSQAPDPAVVAEAAAVLRSGGLVALPTDTLYALAADPFHAMALERVFEAKGRAAAKAVSLLLADAGMAIRLAPALPAAARALMDRFWPGPLTLIVPAAAGLPPALAPPGGGIGLRVPRGALACAVVQRVGGPIVGTSANRAGGPDPRDGQTVLRQVGQHLALLLDGGPTPLGGPSTVVDCTVDPPRLLRAGALPLEVLQAILPDMLPGPSLSEPRK